MSANLEAAVHEAQRYLNELPAPPNEANTCDWVIRPLLVAAGYLNHEILAQSGDVAKKIPDYTLLPSTDHAWFLEAKAWTVALESLHVDQALNYAHSNNRRWVVLTNGKEWRLYDDHIQGLSADRLAAQASLQDSPAILRFLTALSRESMLAKKVDEYASERRVKEFLASAFSDPTSQVVQSIVQTVRKQLPNVKIDPHMVIEFIARLQKPNEKVTTPIEVSAPVTPNSEHLFTIDHKGVKATGVFEGKGIVVQAGSQFSKAPVPSQASAHEKNIKRHLDEGVITEAENYFCSVKDIKFKTPSAASDLVLGASSNGWDWWKDSQGRTLDKVFRSK